MGSVVWASKRLEVLEALFGRSEGNLDVYGVETKAFQGMAKGKQWARAMRRDGVHKNQRESWGSVLGALRGET